MSCVTSPGVEGKAGLGTAQRAGNSTPVCREGISSSPCPGAQARAKSGSDLGEAGQCVQWDSAQGEGVHTRHPFRL